MTTATITLPEIGLHSDVPAEEYHRWPAASQSRLKMLRDKSPAHLKWEMENPSESTPALLLGAAIHTAVLEPEAFHRRYAVADQCAATKRDGDRCAALGRTLGIDGQWYCGRHDGGVEASTGHTVLPREDYETCQALYRAVRSHPYARHLLGGVAERSALWIDPATGVPCKARFDEIAPADVGTITDLKTTRDASPDAFERAIYQYGYYMQAAHYLSGARALGVDVEHFTIIAVEKVPPYAVAVYRIRDDALQAGRDELEPLLARYAECVESDEWPGYPQTIQDIALPPWAWRQVDERLGRV